MGFYRRDNCVYSEKVGVLGKGRGWRTEWLVRGERGSGFENLILGGLFRKIKVIKYCF